MQPRIWAEGAWEPAIVQKGLVAGASSLLLGEVMMNILIWCEMSLPFGGDSVGNRSIVCFSTCYIGFKQE